MKPCRIQGRKSSSLAEGWAEVKSAEDANELLKDFADSADSTV